MFLSGLMNGSVDLFNVLLVVLAVVLIIGLIKKTLWICVAAIVIFAGVGVAENVQFDNASHSVNMFINELFDLDEDHFDIFGKNDQNIIERELAENSDH